MVATPVVAGAGGGVVISFSISFVIRGLCCEGFVPVCSVCEGFVPVCSVLSGALGYRGHTVSHKSEVISLCHKSVFCGVVVALWPLDPHDPAVERLAAAAHPDGKVGGAPDGALAVRKRHDRVPLAVRVVHQHELPLTRLDRVALSMALFVVALSMALFVVLGAGALCRSGCRSLSFWVLLSGCCSRWRSLSFWVLSSCSPMCDSDERADERFPFPFTMVGGADERFPLVVPTPVPTMFPLCVSLAFPFTRVSLAFPFTSVLVGGSDDPSLARFPVSLH